MSPEEIAERMLLLQSEIETIQAQLGDRTSERIAGWRFKAKTALRHKLDEYRRLKVERNRDSTSALFYAEAIEHLWRLWEIFHKHATSDRKSWRTSGPAYEENKAIDMAKTWLDDHKKRTGGDDGKRANSELDDLRLHDESGGRKEFQADETTTGRD